MTLAAGRLRHRVLIEQYALNVDSNGDAIQDPNTGQTFGQWVEVATVWAAIEPLSAKEFIASQATQSQITARIVIRQRSGLDASMRLVHMLSGNVRGQIYNPHGFLADRDSGLEYLTIPVSAGVDNGQ
jgi:SPP1 family predicted phage head-tail adaptor